MNKISFDQFIIQVGLREGQKFNSCHDNRGQFCSSGAGVMGGIENEKARQAVIKSILAVQEHGIANGTEAIEGYDKNGNKIDGMPTGTTNSVVHKDILTDDTYVFVHNHPSSSSFSDGDIEVFANSKAQHMLVVGHDGTLYKLSKPDNWKPSPVRAYISYTASYLDYKSDLTPKYQNLFNEGGNSNVLWKEHSHEILNKLSKDSGFDYVRVLPRGQ